MSPLIWIIDVDHIATEGAEAPSNLNAVGMTGPSDGDETLIEKFADSGQFERFRMYDDDGMLYYEGRIFGDYEGFEPIDHFGMPNAGAVDIKYLNPKTNEWEYI